MFSKTNDYSHISKEVEVAVSLYSSYRYSDSSGISHFKADVLAFLQGIPGIGIDKTFLFKVRVAQQLKAHIYYKSLFDIFCTPAH